MVGEEERQGGVGIWAQLYTVVNTVLGRMQQPVEKAIDHLLVNTFANTCYENIARVHANIRLRRRVFDKTLLRKELREHYSIATD